MLEIGILKTWDEATYKAGVQLAGSLTTYFDDISVAKSIPSAAMVIGNYVILAIPNGNPRDACVIASWPSGSAGGAIEKLDDIGDVDVPSPADGFALYWDNASSLWKCQKIDKTNLSQNFGPSSQRLLNMILTPLSGVLLQINNTCSGPFTATISGAPSSTQVVYANPSNEEMFTNHLSSSWGKIILHNLTRGNSRKIESVNIATNTITTQESVDDWASGDSVTTKSQTNPWQGFFDLDLSAQVPATTEALLLNLLFHDNSNTYVSNRTMILHPYEALDWGKILPVDARGPRDTSNTQGWMKVVSQKITIWFRATTDAAMFISGAGYAEYADV